MLVLSLLDTSLRKMFHHMFRNSERVELSGRACSQGLLLPMKWAIFTLLPKLKNNINISRIWQYQAVHRNYISFVLRMSYTLKAGRYEYVADATMLYTKGKCLVISLVDQSEKYMFKSPWSPPAKNTKSVSLEEI